jgi:hypothetical protein
MSGRRPACRAARSSMSAWSSPAARLRRRITAPSSRCAPGDIFYMEVGFAADSLVEEAVMSEPVSGPRDSLLAGKIQAIF